jgi:chemotaxis protein histidine kinase CheA
MQMEMSASAASPPQVKAAAAVAPAVAAPAAGAALSWTSYAWLALFCALCARFPFLIVYFAAAALLSRATSSNDAKLPLGKEASGAAIDDKAAAELAVREAQAAARAALEARVAENVRQAIAAAKEERERKEAAAAEAAAAAVAEARRKAAADAEARRKEAAAVAAAAKREAAAAAQAKREAAAAAELAAHNSAAASEVNAVRAICTQAGALSLQRAQLDARRASALADAQLIAHGRLDNVAPEYEREQLSARAGALSFDLERLGQCAGHRIDAAPVGGAPRATRLQLDGVRALLDGVGAERTQLAGEYEALRASADALLRRLRALPAPSPSLLARPQHLDVAQTLAGNADSELLRLACRVEYQPR